MIKVTLDSNIIIKATKPEEADNSLAMRLIELHKHGAISLQVVTANAYERGRSMSGPDRSLFNDLEMLGIYPNETKLLLTDWKLGLTALDYSYTPSEETVALIQKVWDAIYSPIPMDHVKFCQYYKVSLGLDDIHPKWRNYMCDVMTVVEYIRDSNEEMNSGHICILVTADDDDILKHVNALQKLGAKRIRRLKDALNDIDSLLTEDA